MTDKTQALQRLLDAVEAGSDDENHHAAALPSESAYGKCTWHDSLKASRGSLDAAKALHDALVPGWDLLITTYEDGLFEVSVSEPLVVKTYDGLSEIIARAWLLALIRAVMAGER